ncbi:hypothetical protein EUGRSUZ_I00718 [Eucalyptus grandis]|uniref:Uncharacterized protein n=2 Tax=Eucalyptus grandis TaxID=71139 RepID=A0ACC3JCJ4_EUCGR|nr:hypothetical protein EUGRSUZ_I00718 [Eucalyptus grandis]
MNWKPKAMATVSLVCKWFDDLAKRVLWKEFCRMRAPKMMLHLQSSGSHRIECSKDGLFNNVQVPGHFIHCTQFSRTMGKGFLMPPCKNDVLYVSDPCEHLDQGDEGDVGFFRGVFKSFSMSMVKGMLIQRGAQLHPTGLCPYHKAKLWSMPEAKMIPQRASCRLGAYSDSSDFYVCPNAHILGNCNLLPLSDSEEAFKLQ